MGDKFYVVESGTLTCSISGLGVVAEYSRGESFGELALLYDTPRAATIEVPTFAQECAVWSIDVAHFKQIAVRICSRVEYLLLFLYMILHCCPDFVDLRASAALFSRLRTASAFD